MTLSRLCKLQNALHARVCGYERNLCFQHKAFKLSGKTGNRSSPVFVNNNFHQHDVLRKFISRQKCGDMMV